MLLISMGTMGVLILVGILACLTSWTMNKCVVSITSLFLFVFFILLIIFGAVLYVPGAYGEKFIIESCKFTNEGKYDQISPS